MNSSIVLLVHQSADLYGSDRVLLNLVSGLMNENFFVPVVILPNQGPLFDALKLAGAEVHIGEVAKVTRSVFNLPGIVRLLFSIGQAVHFLDKVVGKRKIVALHTNTLAVLGGVAWAVFRRVPHVWHVHEIIVSPRLVSRAYPLLVRLFSDRVVANSTLTLQWLTDVQPSIRNKAVVVFNGLPEIGVVERATGAGFRCAVGAADCDVVVTLVGRFNRMKGHRTLIDAADLLAREGRLGRLRFAFVGSAAPGQENLPNELRDYLDSLNLTSKFVFLDFVENVWPIWAGTDIAVVPSTEPESFGLVAIEAMAAGLPVVASGHGGILDIVRNGETGLLFEPGNALALAEALYRLSQSNADRERFGVAGKALQLAQFSATRQIVDISRIYKDLNA